jgi:hypothetical protein
MMHYALVLIIVRFYYLKVFDKSTRGQSRPPKGGAPMATSKTAPRPIGKSVSGRGAAAGSPIAAAEVAAALIPLVRITMEAGRRARAVVRAMASGAVTGFRDLAAEARAELDAAAAEKKRPG